MRLRSQIILLLGALVMMMGVFTILYFPAQREASALKYLQREAVHTSGIIAGTAAAALGLHRNDRVRGSAELQNVIQIAREDSDLAYLQFFDRAGNALPEYFGNLADRVEFSNHSKLRVMTGASVIHVYQPVRIANQDTPDERIGDRLGAIQIGFSLEPMQLEIRHERNVTAAVVLSMVLFAIMIAFLRSNEIMRPLEALEKVVYSFGQGHEDVRARADGPNEISQLGAVFNHMADSLAQNSARERKKAAELERADRARLEVESKFRGAFENAPIGLALLDAAGQLYNTNPALKDLFGSASGEDLRCCFVETIEEADQKRFESLFAKLVNSESDSFEDHLACVNGNGDVIRTIVNLSAVRSSTDEFRYAVLQIQDVTEATKLTDLLEHQASYDELTGLLNRQSFDAELTRAWEQGGTKKNLSFMMVMDLDQFKIVNDSSGHAAGDQLLRRVSDILLENVRGDDFVCRLGGDEFGIILSACPADVAAKIAESIRACVESYRFRWDSETHRIGVSIGGLPIDPAVGDAIELQKIADAACYAAKEGGRNRVHIVQGDKDVVRLNRGQIRWVPRIRNAMDKNLFVIYGQTIAPLADNADEPGHIEILLRLRDPAARKTIPPGAFLPAADRYGLSIELDQWVVRNLLDKLFVHDSFNAEQRKYWINLSGTSIGDKRFADFLIDAVEKSPLPAGTINFEITETAVIRSVVQAGKLMSALRELGCLFALDDFGSGLSSFGHLKELPVDHLKIDGMFIRDILSDKTNKIFVKSIIDIGHALGLRVVAEFVENAEILDVVRELGADYGQGYEIGRPYELAPKFPETGGSGTASIDTQEHAG